MDGSNFSGKGILILINLLLCLRLRAFVLTIFILKEFYLYVWDEEIEFYL